MNALDAARDIEAELASAPIDADDYEERYRAAEDAQGSGEYEEFLERIEQREQKTALARAAADLELLRGVPEAIRARELDWLLRYWSRANGAFEETGLRLAKATKKSEGDLRAGRYDSEELASRVIEACARYDRDVTIPVVRQVAAKLARFEGGRFLLLGRDFTCAYLFMRKEGRVPRERLHLANVSRNVRDQCLADEHQLVVLAAALARAGIRSPDLLADGGPFVVADSSMKGKIPAVVLRALVRHLSPSERWQILSKTHVRYLKSSRRRGESIRERANTLGGSKKELGDAELEEVLDGRRRIREFDGMRFPPQVASHVQRRHKILEWRPKSVQVATKVELDAGGTPRFATDCPRTPAQRVACLLGVLADLQLARAGEDEARARHASSAPATFVLARNEGDAPASFEAIRREIDRAASGGVASLRRWQRERPRGGDDLAILQTESDEVPYALYQGDRLVRRLRRIAGEGNNVVAYVTEEGTVLKVVKRAAHARKNLLLAWAEGVVADAGIDAAAVLDVPASGLYLEQEYVPGKSLEERYGGEGTGGLPRAIRELVLADFERAKRLVKDRGVWLDLKSANYQEREDGRIAIVDYTPRVNETHHRYFRHDDGRELSEEEFLDKFLHYDLRKKCASR